MVHILRVGIAGLGTVGAGVVTLLAKHEEVLEKRTGTYVKVTAVSARDRRRDRGIEISTFAWFDDAVALAVSPDIDVFVELIGGEEGPAKASVEAALRAGKHVVTANKALLARHGAALAALAEQNGVALSYEAAVAGAIPVIKTLREGLVGNEISRISGILNGTCNYILSRMELEAMAFDTCLRDAQALGFAEADPTFDIGGFDTAHKLAILASLAFGTVVDADAVNIEGIEAITLADIRAANELGFRIKLLGVAERTPHGIEQRVHPTMVPKTSAIAQVMGVTNAVTIDADAARQLTLVGPGAGGLPTASSVVADIGDIARGLRLPVFGLPVSLLAPAERIEMRSHEGGYYIRLSVHDRPGAFAAIATRMGQRQISLESIVQRRSADVAALPGSPVSVLLITHATSEAMIREALDGVVADGFISEKPQVVRIERE